MENNWGFGRRAIAGNGIFNLYLLARCLVRAKERCRWTDIGGEPLSISSLRLPFLLHMNLTRKRLS